MNSCPCLTAHVMLLCLWLLTKTVLDPPPTCHSPKYDLYTDDDQQQQHRSSSQCWSCYPMFPLVSTSDQHQFVASHQSTRTHHQHEPWQAALDWSILWSEINMLQQQSLSDAASEKLILSFKASKLNKKSPWLGVTRNCCVIWTRLNSFVMKQPEPKSGREQFLEGPDEGHWMTCCYIVTHLRYQLILPHSTILHPSVVRHFLQHSNRNIPKIYFCFRWCWIHRFLWI